MNTGNQSFAAPMLVSKPPGSLAMSPDGRYLVVGEDNDFLTASDGGLAIFDLNAGQQIEIDMPDPVLAVAFGAGSQALVVTSTAVLLLNPATGVTKPVTVQGAPTIYTACLPVPFATFPPNILQASAGVSGGAEIPSWCRVPGGDALVTHKHNHHYNDNYTYDDDHHNGHDDHAGCSLPFDCTPHLHAGGGGDQLRELEICPA